MYPLLCPHKAVQPNLIRLPVIQYSQVRTKPYTGPSLMYGPKSLCVYCFLFAFHLFSFSTLPFPSLHSCVLFTLPTVAAPLWSPFTAQARYHVWAAPLVKPRGHGSERHSRRGFVSSCIYVFLSSLTSKCQQRIEHVTVTVQKARGSKRSVTPKTRTCYKTGEVWRSCVRCHANKLFCELSRFRLLWLCLLFFLALFVCGNSIFQWTHFQQGQFPFTAAGLPLYRYLLNRGCRPPFRYQRPFIILTPWATVVLQ
jgi:hypothetical protein